jgi:two-component system, LytTR family, response regulator
MLKDIPVFFRSHKSYIINMREVKEYVKSDGGYLVLSNGAQAGLSSEKVEEFLKKF